MQEETPQSEEPGATGRPATRRALRIVHISDLHFGHEFDLGLWDHVRALVRREAPDLIVVSGDLVNSPWPFMLAVARRELDDLARAAGTVAVVVPGNHDVALLGNIYVPAARHLFRALFSRPLGGGGAGPLDGLPTYAELRAASRFGRLRARAKGYAALLRRFWKRPRRGARGHGPLPRVWHDPAGRAVTVLLDSTFSGSLASGFIDEREIYGIDAELGRLLDRGDLQSALALRIAVLHHHPLPLPYSIVTEALTSYEPFLVLRNAGTLLRELWKHDFDLVLHGHKHFHSYARVGYGAAREDGARLLSVLAAGSASVRHTEAGRNSLNVIEVHANGRVVVKPTVFGGGMSWGGDPSTYVQPLADLKARNFRRTRDAQGLSARRVTRRVKVEAHGGGELELRVEGLRVHGRYATRRRRHELAVDPGRIDPTAVELIAPERPGLALRHEGDDPAGRLVAWVDLGGTLEPDAEPADYTLRFDTPNAFLASGWEADELSDAAPGDYVRAHVGYPLEELVIDLTLPDWLGARPAGDEAETPADDTRAGQPWVRCLMPRDYPALPLDEQHEVVPAPLAQLELDGEMTAHESGSLMRVGDRHFILRVAHPMVGYAYELRWPVPVKPIRSALVVGQTADLRRVLLDYRQERLAGRDPAGGDAMRALLDNLLAELTRRFGSTVRDEHLALGVRAYDAESRALVQVEGVRNWDRPLDLTHGIPFGEGLAGAVFKQCRALLYVRPELQRSRGGRVYLYDDDQHQPARTHYEAMVAVPLVHPANAARAAVDPRAVVGTLSFGSDSPSSGLVALLDLEPEEREALLKDLVSVGQAAFEALLEVLLGETRVRAMLASGGRP